MTLHETIIADASSVFCNADEFAEPVLYRSGAGNRDSIPVDAVVIRNGYQDDAHGQSLEIFEVHVPLSVIEAVTAGQDSISFPKRVGETATYQTVARVITHDEGMWVLECR